MKPQSAKAKGRNLQKMVRDMILKAFTSLTDRDVRSTSMGAGGADVTLSQKAFEVFPYSIECKWKQSLKGLYDAYDQAATHGDGTPVLFVKNNHREVLAVVTAEHFFNLVRSKHD